MIIKDVYDVTKMNIHIHEGSKMEKIKLEREVRQVDTILPKHFTLA